MTGKTRRPLVYLSTITLAPIALAIFYLVSGKEPQFDEFGRGHEAFNMGRFDVATEILEPLAMYGDQRAQYYLSVIEAFGLGRAIDRNMAKDWAARAGADEVRGLSECSIGVDWGTGRFGKLSIEDAAYWIAYADELRGEGFCLESPAGKRLNDAQRSEISQRLRASSF